MRKLGHVIDSAIEPIRLASALAIEIADTVGAGPDSAIAARLFDVLLLELQYATTAGSDDC
jgi:hypothetical protein